MADDDKQDFADYQEDEDRDFDERDDAARDETEEQERDDDLEEEQKDEFADPEDESEEGPLEEDLSRDPGSPDKDQAQSSSVNPDEPEGNESKEDHEEPSDPQAQSSKPALTQADLDNTSAVNKALSRACHDPKRLYERSEDLPDAIKRKLEALDQESAQAQGQSSAGAQIDDGGSRFFGLAQSAITRSKSRMSRSAELFKKNFKIFVIVILAFAGYYVYLNYIGEPVIQSFSELKQATPLKLDDYTTLNKVEEDGPWIVMEIIKDEGYYQGQSIAQREASLDRIEANAQSLCSNSILGSMIRNGRKITVLLKGSAGSFTRNFTVEQCPGTENDQPQ